MIALIYEYPKEREWLGRLFVRQPDLFGRLGFQIIAGRPGMIPAYGAGYGGRAPEPGPRPVDWELVAGTLALALQFGGEDARNLAIDHYQHACAHQDQDVLGAPQK